MTYSWAAKMNIAMAKSKSFFGHRRGSTKSHTYQVNSGQQITKDRVDEVKNPRTSAQMVHRCCLHTLSDAHAYLRPFIGRFWEGAQTPAASLAAFRKANYPILRAAAESNNPKFSFSPFGVTTTPSGLFQVADGSLPLTHFSLSSPTIGNQTVAFSANKSDAKNDYFEEVLSKNGLRVGDILNIVVFYLNISSLRYDYCYAILRIANPGHVKWTSVPWSSKFELIKASAGFDWGSTNLANHLCSIRWRFLNVTSGNKSQKGFCVVQRSEGGHVKYSPSFMAGTNITGLMMNFQQAIATYPQGGSNALNGDPL